MLSGLYKNTMDWRDKRRAKDPSSPFFSFHSTIIAASLSFWGGVGVLGGGGRDRQLNGADITLSVKVFYLLWPSHRSPSCGLRIHPFPFLYLCNLHPPLCLECLAHDWLPPSSSFIITRQNAYHPLTSATHELQLSYNVIKTNIPVLHLTV